MKGFEANKQSLSHAPEASRTHSQNAEKQYRFNVAFIDDNSVHIRDAGGREVAFEFPLKNVRLEDYDRFIDQMRNSESPVPPIGMIDLAIGKVTTDISFKRQLASGNSSPTLMTWQQHAAAHGITVDEMKSMYEFAREALYKRYLSRLRNREKQ